METLLEAGFSLVGKILQTITGARALAAEKQAAILAAFKAAESALDTEMLAAHARVEAEAQETEQAIHDAETKA